MKVSNERAEGMRREMVGSLGLYSPYPYVSDLLDDREELLGLLKAYEALADQFMAKVDSGAARSSETYATFKSLRERS